MKLFKNNYVIFFLYVIFYVLSAYFLSKGKQIECFVFMIIRSSMIGLYYFNNIKKLNYLILGYIFIATISGFLMIIDINNILGSILMFAYKIILIRYVYRKVVWKSIDMSSIIFVSIVMLSILAINLVLYFSYSYSFWIIIVGEFLLFSVFFFSFVNLLNDIKRGNLYFFTAVALIIISDTVFAFQPLSKINPFLLLLTSVLQNVSYFLVVKSDIKYTNCSEVLSPLPLLD